MKLKDGGFLKRMRKTLGYNQEEMAHRLNISRSQLARMEAGAVAVDIWHFIALMELAGMPAQDFWTLTLETHEFENYKMIKSLKRLIRADKTADAKVLLAKLKDSLEVDSKVSAQVNQYIAFADIVLQDDIKREDALKMLDEALFMTKKNFNEDLITNYRLTYNEIDILVQKAWHLFELDEKERAIKITKSLIASRKNMGADETDRAYVFPTLMSNLSTMLGRIGNYKESLICCLEAMSVCEELQEFEVMPLLLYNAASCHRLLGESKDVWLPIILRAYYAARANRQHQHHNNH